MAAYYLGANLTWEQHLQTNSFVQDINKTIRKSGKETRQVISNQTKQLIAGNEALSRNFKQAVDEVDGTLAEGFGIIGGKIDIVNQGIEELGALHTWGQTLSCHPHGHFVVPAGGVDANGEWVWPASHAHNFLFPVHAMAKVYRGKFIAGLKQAYARKHLVFPGALSDYAEESDFEAWLDVMVSKNWVVYAKAPFSGPEHVVRYVSRYTHRVAISNQRILSIEHGRVRFTYKNYKKKSECEHVEELWEEMELPAEEFIRRFLHHVLPSGYHRIRYYGFLSGSQKARLQAIWEELVFEEEQGLPEVTAMPSWKGLPCPACDDGILEIALVVTAKGQVVYSNPSLLAIPSANSECESLEAWDTS